MIGAAGTDHEGGKNGTSATSREKASPSNFRIALLGVSMSVGFDRLPVLRILTAGKRNGGRYYRTSQLDWTVDVNIRS